MISPESKTIEQILSGTKVTYSVPKYQRSFNWGITELQELIDDLKETVFKKSKNDFEEVRDQALFLGNFIFDTSDPTNYQIVDGQQRLTTISILLIALREHAKKINENAIENELQRFISIYSDIREKNDVKFSVSDNIRTIYEHMTHPEWNGEFPDSLKGKSIKRQVNKVKPIYEFIERSLSKFNRDHLKSFINALWDAYVVVIKVESNEDVFSVFERTNARGLDLNIGDLLKNYIFSHQDDILEQTWSQIVENAEGALPRMLKYFWVSRRGYIQHSKLYKSLKTYVKEIELDDNNDKSRINAFVNELYTFSRFYHSAQSLDPYVVKDWFDEYGITGISKN